MRLLNKKIQKFVSAHKITALAGIGLVCAGVISIAVYSLMKPGSINLPEMMPQSVDGPKDQASVQQDAAQNQPASMTDQNGSQEGAQSPEQRSQSDPQSGTTTGSAADSSPSPGTSASGGGGSGSGGSSAGGGTSGGGVPVSTSSPPTGAYASNTSATSISITFTAGADSDGIARHELVRSGAVKAMSTSQNTAITLTDNTVYSGNTYSYSVRAVDALGNVGASSNTVVVTLPPDTVAPSAPTNFRLISNSSGEAVIAWNESTDDKTPQDDIWYVVESIAAPYYYSTKITPSTVYTEIGDTYNFYILAVDLAGNESAKVGPLTFTGQ